MHSSIKVTTVAPVAARVTNVEATCRVMSIDSLSVTHADYDTIGFEFHREGRSLGSIVLSREAAYDFVDAINTLIDDASAADRDRLNGREYL